MGVAVGGGVAVGSVVGVADDVGCTAVSVGCSIGSDVLVGTAVISTTSFATSSAAGGLVGATISAGVGDDAPQAAKLKMNTKSKTVLI